MSWTLAELADALGARLDGPPDQVITGPAAPDADDPHGLAFCASRRYAVMAERSGVGAVITPDDLPVQGKPRLLAEDPREAFSRFLLLYRPEEEAEPGVHATARISPSARVDPSASLGAYVVVEEGATIGPRARVLPFCHIGRDCVVGEGSMLHPHVVLYPRTRLGRDCLVMAGAVIGSAGLAFFRGTDGSWRGFPQVGEVELEDGVQIGAGSVVERAAFGTTRIGADGKVGAHVTVGHNVVIGRSAVISGQVGIAGSAVIGDDVVLAGRVAVVDHVTIGDGVTLGACSAVMRSLPEAGAYLGTPARPMAETLRGYALLPRLPELLARIKDLEARCRELEGR
jgi:UDP-3-O-[3-hydroxymyristoyl] glucosamine N-acyltransferase